MLSSNWSQGSTREFGCRVIRQRIGRAKPAKSNAPHKCMSYVERAILCAKLERQAAQ